LGVFDDEIHLPGVITQVEADYSYGYDSSLFGTTDSVVIIGTAFNGPVGQITPVYSVEHAVYVFGEAYSSIRRQEATLVAGVQDAWARGCRTIYCVRIGGREMYKDFDFKIETGYRLRVSSQFPSNQGKECYMLYDDRAGAEKITFYKPSSRATIAEKRRGMTTASGTMMKTTINLATDNGLTAETRLTDLINLFNRNTFNNALKLSIVDKDGNDVTLSTEVYDLRIGSLYPGVYFIGRSHTNDKATIVTKKDFRLTKTDLVAGTTNAPYKDYTGKYFNVLQYNTDVTQPLPIYDVSMSNLRERIKGAGVVMLEDWDFLNTEDLTDRVFIPNDEDYEEIDLNEFEIYKRLGSGFAITAQAIRRVDSHGVERAPRIKETDSKDVNRIQTIEDGIYSMLQDANIKYRVLTGVNAEDSIVGKLPRAKDFRIVVAKDKNVLSGDFSLKAKVDKHGLEHATKYKISFEDSSNDTAIKVEDIYQDKVFKVIGGVSLADKDKVKAEDYANGTLVAIDDEVYRVGDKKLEKAGNSLIGDILIVNHELKKVNNAGKLVAAVAADYGSKHYVLASVVDNIFVYDVSVSPVKNVGDLTSILSTEEDKFTIVAENISTPDYVNEIKIRSNMFDTTTVSELAEMLNNHPIFGRLFSVKLTTDGSIEKDDFVTSAEKAKYAFAGVSGTVNVPAHVETKKFSEVASADQQYIQGSPPSTPPNNGNWLPDDMVTVNYPDQTKTISSSTEVVELEDREGTYDYSLYIPYRTTDNFLRQLAQHCQYTELKTAPTHGVMGTQRLVSTGITSVANKVEKILQRDFDLYAKTAVGRNMLDSNALPYPIGRMVSLVVGQYPVTMQTSTYTYTSTGGPGYAAMVSKLPIDQSSTGQTIELPSIDYQLTNSQLARLTTAGIVTFKKSFTKGIVVTDGITMAPSESVFRRLSTTRIVGAVEELIRAAAEPFIGKENHAANRNALNTELKAALDKIKGTLIEQYEFKMNLDVSIQKLSYIEVTYQIVPIYEIREVRNTIKMVDTISASSAVG